MNSYEKCTGESLLINWKLYPELLLGSARVGFYFFSSLVFIKNKQRIHVQDTLYKKI